MMNEEPESIYETEHQEIKETRHDKSNPKSTSTSYLSSGTLTPFCDSPTHQFSFNSSHSHSQSPTHHHHQHNLNYKFHSPPTRTYTGTSSIPSVSITPSLFDDSPQPTTPPTLYDDPISTSDLVSPSPTIQSFPNSFQPSTHSTSKSFSNHLLSKPNQIPLQLPSSSLINHRRHSSQPSTPIPVKETFNGSISSYGTKEGQRKLNQYLLIKTIGKGSYGSVELAQDLSSNEHQLYAIKEYSKSRMRKRARVLDSRMGHGGFRGRRPPNILLDSGSTSGSASGSAHSIKVPVRSMSDGMGLVKAEVAIMKKLAHPNIVSLIEVIDTDTDSLFFVLELCPYGSVMPIELGKDPNSSRLSINQSKNIFRQIVLGIEYLHFNEILHRDIKPDNVLFFDDPTKTEMPLCKIVDFGVSEKFGKDGDDTTKKLAGSPAFISPELCASTGGTRGKPADIWAMGVTLYTLVVGKLPFEDTNQLALCEKIMKDPLFIPDGMDPDLEDLLNRLLDKSPDSRIEMHEIKEHPWVTNHSQDPLPSTSENVTPVNPPTELEIAYAFKSLRSLSTIVKAVTRLKARYRLSRRTLSHDDDDDEIKPTILRNGNLSVTLEKEKEKEKDGKEESGVLEESGVDGSVCLSPGSLVLELDPTSTLTSTLTSTSASTPTSTSASTPTSTSLLSPPSDLLISPSAPAPASSSSSDTLGFEESFETRLDLNQ